MPYAVAPDPYCYPGSTVLKNIPDLREEPALEQYEKRVYRVRGEQPLPSGKLSAAHYRAVHKHLFQDVFIWAGRYRTVRISKGSSSFCYPEHIASQMTTLFADLRAKRYLRGLSAEIFASELAQFLTTLNAIHPFREGNGRTQLTFLSLLAAQAGHPLVLERLEPQAFLAAMIAGFNGDERALTKSLRAMND